VAVVQRGDRLRLALEPAARRVAMGEIPGQDFDCDGSIQSSVVAAVNVSHAAAAD